MLADPFARDDPAPQRTKGRKIVATVAGLYKAAGRDFETAATDALDLTFEGIEGDVHAGNLRPRPPRRNLIVTSS